MEIETDSKSDALSVSWRNRIAPQLRWVRPLSVRTETPEGGVVVSVFSQGLNDDARNDWKNRFVGWGPLRNAG